MMKKAVFVAHCTGILTLVILGLSACAAPPQGIAQSTLTATPSHTGHQGVKVTALSLHTSPSALGGLVAGLDNTLWFMESKNGGITIAKLALEGQVAEFPVPNDSMFGLMAVGTDGNAWFGGGSSLTRTFVARITPEGRITEFPLPHAGDFPGAMTLGTDGNIWFVVYQSTHSPVTSIIGRISSTGAITEFTLPPCVPNGPPEQTQISGIIAGPDGNVWYDLVSSPACGAFRIDSITAKGTVNTVSVLDVDLGVGLMALGPHETVWLTQMEQKDDLAGRTSKIVCIGCVTNTHIPTAFDSLKRGQVVAGLVMGPDGKMWFTGSSEVDGSGFVGDVTLGGQITTYALPGSTKPDQPVLGSDNALYFVDHTTNQLERAQIVD